MITGRHAIIFLILFFMLMCITISVFSFVEEWQEKRRIKRVVKLAEDQGFGGDSDIASLTAFRIHVKKQIEECEDCAENYRALLKEIEDAIENTK